MDRYMEDVEEIVNDFENCGDDGACVHCKCYERLNSTDSNICELLLIYRKHIRDKITELLDNM